MAALGFHVAGVVPQRDRLRSSVNRRRQSVMAVVFRIACMIAAVRAVLCAVAPARSLAGDDSLAKQVAELLDDLDSPRYTVRDYASKRLETLSKQAEIARRLSHELRQALLSREMSLEAVTRVRSLLRRLPEPAPSSIASPTIAPSTEQIERWIDELDADRFAIRSAARRRLASAARDESRVCLLLTRLKRRLADPELALDARSASASIYEQARGVWLLSDPKSWKLPPVSEPQISRWTTELARDAADLAAYCAARGRA